MFGEGEAQRQRKLRAQKRHRELIAGRNKDIAAREREVAEREAIKPGEYLMLGTTFQSMGIKPNRFEITLNSDNSFNYTFNTGYSVVPGCGFGDWTYNLDRKTLTIKGTARVQASPHHPTLDTPLKFAFVVETFSQGIWECKDIQGCNWVFEKQ